MDDNVINFHTKQEGVEAFEPSYIKVGYEEGSDTIFIGFGAYDDPNGEHLVTFCMPLEMAEEMADRLNRVVKILDEDS